MASGEAPRKIRLVFFRSSAGAEPVREWLKELDEAERRAIGADLLRAQRSWPGGHAVVPADGKRLVGSADRLDDETDGACPALPLSRSPGRPARFYQEDTDNAG